MPWGFTELGVGPGMALPSFRVDAGELLQHVSRVAYSEKIGVRSLTSLRRFTARCALPRPPRRRGHEVATRCPICPARWRRPTLTQRNIGRVTRCRRHQRTPAIGEPFPAEKNLTAQLRCPEVHVGLRLVLAPGGAAFDRCAAIAGACRAATGRLTRGQKGVKRVQRCTDAAQSGRA